MNFQEIGWGPGLVLSGLSGFCECGNEPLCFVKCWEFLTRLETFRLSVRTALHKSEMVEIG
jgi:hypothetical protein